MTDTETDLARYLEAEGVDARTAARLAHYGALLLAANRNLNLSAARSVEALVPHVLDALTVLGDVAGPLVDIGSGNGLPGIPLAIAAGVEVTLVEAVAKKARFLSETLVALELAGNVSAVRAERFGRDPVHRERYATATARAVASAPAVAELTIPLLRVGGRALLQRGALDERERQAVEDAAPMLGARVVEERQLEGSRRILILEKVVPTPVRFPRRDGVPEKRPLCYAGAALKP